jgi:lipoic acid synthetase
MRPLDSEHGEARGAAGGAAPPRREGESEDRRGESGGRGAPRPEWLRKQKRFSPEVLRTRRGIDRLGLHTVCESARCPNLGECYSRGNATFLILGDHCTRNCAFCAVQQGPPQAPDAEEGRRIAVYIREGGIRFAVITSVTRDDLPDGGSGHFVRVVDDIRAAVPAVKLELLVPDFRGRREAVQRVASLPVEVFAHNVETVPALYPRVRAGADYRRSLAVLRMAAAARRPGVRLKSGIMVGLGETRAQLEALFADLAACAVDVLTIGQYLAPSKKNSPVVRYYKPEEFRGLQAAAREAGIPSVVAGPYVRSSYLAEQAYLEAGGKSG